MNLYEFCVTALAVTFILLWVFEKSNSKTLQKLIDENYKSHIEFLDKLVEQLKVLQTLKDIKGTKDETKETSKDDLSKD